MNPTSKLIIVGVVALVAIWFLFFRSDSNETVISNIPARDTGESGLTIIAFGDSLTAGYGLPVSDSYPAQLETALRAKGLSVSIINSGVSGETTRGNLERAKFIRSQNPDIVILGIGGNDALRNLPVSETKSNIEETVKVLQSGENPPVVILLKMQGPINSGLAYKRDFDAIYEEVAKSYNLILVPFLTAELFLDSANKLNDGIHYNATGYQKVVDQHLVPVLEEVIEQITKNQM